MEKTSAVETPDGDAAVDVRRDGGLVTIRLNRPKTRNAITEDDIDTLIVELRTIEDSPGDRAVLIAGSERGFCAGIDLTARLKRPMTRFMRRVGELATRLHHLPMPTVAAVQGPAVGVGFSLALACDFIIADENSYFLLPFHQRGLTLDGGATWLLPKRIGIGRAKEVAFLGERIGAARALELGIANAVSGTADFDATVYDWLSRLVAGPPQAQRMSKELLNAADTIPFETALAAEAYAQSVASASDEAREGIKAFVTKRVPTFPDA